MGSRRAAPPPRAVVLDSDVLIGYLRGDPAARRFFEMIPYSRRLLPAVVGMELMRGCRDRGELRRLTRFLDASFVGLLHISEEISRRAAALVERHALSHDISPDDALIAATALTIKAALATGNLRDYRFISGLELLPFRPRG